MIICVCGPTGIGKTKLSELIAEKYRAIILNADATQIYQELNIGSAKITKDEMGNRKHYLFDIKKPNEDYSVMEYQNDARKVLNDNKSKNIVVVGGTGLYIKALFFDYVFDEMKKNSFDNLSNDELYTLAIKKNSNCNLHKNNRVRLVNFLNRTKEEKNKNIRLYDVIFVGLTAERNKIYDICNKRVDIMINNGLINEVKTLKEKYPDSNILKRAIGYKELISYLEGDSSYNDAIELIKKNTRHYVKRQYTWFNNQLDVKWFDVDFDNFNNTYENVVEYIESNKKAN